MAGELRLAGVFCRRVCAGGEDILLSERDGGGSGRENGRASCRKRSEREQGREISQKKIQVLTKILRNRVL